MSRDIIRFCGTTLQRFSKNDPVLTRVPGAYPLYNCQRKVKAIFKIKTGKYQVI